MNEKGLKRQKLRERPEEETRTRGAGPTGLRCTDGNAPRHGRGGAQRVVRLDGGRAEAHGAIADTLQQLV